MKLITFVAQTLINVFTAVQQQFSIAVILVSFNIIFSQPTQMETTYPET